MSMMPEKVDTAVILAAGLGSRLKEKTQFAPKGLLPFHGKPLVPRSIEALKRAGISRIIIGTGHLASQYDLVAKETDGVSCVLNPHYAETGSLYTLYNLRSAVQDSSFLLLESDLLYENRALELLLASPDENIILASGTTNGGDEVYIEADSQSRFVNLSKTSAGLRRADGELTGISKVSSQLFKALCKTMETSLQTQPKMDYERGFVECARELPISVMKVEDLIWCEIDDEAQWRRAEEVILPRLNGKSNA
jgi:2-aminoethylphosphonate-pyruvate transaminase